MALLATGKHTVTALTRKESSSRFPPEFKVAQVDYTEYGSLVTALTGQDSLVISLSHFSAPDTQSLLLRAATEAGVQWIIPNSYGPDVANPVIARDLGAIPRLTDGIKACEEAKEGESRIHVVTAFWYEFVIANAPNVIGLDLKGRKMTMLDDGKTQINMTSLPQAGRAIAKLLSLPILPEDERDASVTLSNWRNKPLYTASYLLSQRDILASIQRQTGTADADWAIDYQTSESRYKEGLEAFGQGDIMKGMGYTLGGRVFYPNGDGYFENKEGWANEKLGLEKEVLDEGTKLAIQAAEAKEDLFKAF